jgi:hypothetical protein
MTRAEGNDKSTSIPGAFPGVVINDVKAPEAAGIGQPVIHEVHGQLLVDLPGHSQWIRHIPLQALFRLDPEIQLQFPVNTVYMLLVVGQPFTLRRYRKHSPKPQVRLVVISRNRQSAIKAFSPEPFGRYR